MAMADDGTGGTLGREEFPDALPARPAPVAHPSTSPRINHFQPDEKDTHIYHKGYLEYQHPSLSSSAARSLRTVDSIDIEKQAFKSPLFEQDEHVSHRSSLPRSDRRTSHPPTTCNRVGAGSDSSPPHQTIQHCYDDDDDDELVMNPDLAAKSIRLLLFFLCPLPFLSFALTIWTIIITLVLSLLHPIRLIFTRKRSFSEIVLSLLAPTLNLHFRSVYSDPVAANDLRLFHTVVALLGGSILSVGIAAWAGVLGVYWILAAIIGNPDGLDGRSEGREMVLTTRQKWVSWLSMSLRPQALQQEQ
ncbi:hypothetical protein K461DRAFT_277442 [Myriangium duriaei CBS 260.36]|uniref:Uncharacterized protein n=1 Tax=Myriangium duriaei CBS 260.36 TaxID=1168546 RepID=A0A9P4MLL0_9PEZI|nr:hypothetical protein K461DRAFT_277442 [Myriangium duriaei CBS 260.36]